MALRKTINALTVGAKTCQPMFLQKLVLFHNTPCLEAWKGGSSEGPTHWLDYNKKVYPPQKPDEEPRPAVSYLSLLV